VQLVMWREERRNWSRPTWVKGVIHLPLSARRSGCLRSACLAGIGRGEVVVFCHAGIRSWQFGPAG